ncbi:MAG: class I SAM-dependent methyltransferase [FCB group bacterium]|nr:class I SAM-dependent methyltransferase [FCB group bacterium]
MSKYGGYEDTPRLAELYDLVPMYNNRADRDFYLKQARSADGPVLELGCGSGRILIPCAKAGCDITGLDLSTHMLTSCRTKVENLPNEMRERVRLVQGSMVDFDLKGKYSLVTIPFRALQHIIGVEEQLAGLSCINRHLQMNGTLIFDVFQVDMKIMSRILSDKEIENTPEFKLPDGCRLRRTHRVVAVDSVNQFNNVEIIYYLTELSGEVRRYVQAFPFRYYFRFELEHLLARTGFKIVDLFGDFDESPLKEESPEMIFIAEKVREI